MRLLSFGGVIIGLTMLLAGPVAAGEGTLTGSSDAIACPAGAKGWPVWGKLRDIVVDPFISDGAVDKFVAPGDPFGRMVSHSSGAINAIGTGILISTGPGPAPGTLAANTRHVFTLNPRDLLKATGVLVLTLIPNSVDVGAELTLTLAGGTGLFEGATGEIVATGRGVSLFDGVSPFPSPTAGSTHYAYRIHGYVCLVEHQ